MGNDGGVDQGSSGERESNSGHILKGRITRSIDESGYRYKRKGSQENIKVFGLSN